MILFPCSRSLSSGSEFPFLLRASDSDFPFLPRASDSEFPFLLQASDSGSSRGSF